jgi:hypothetical protein
MKRPSIVSLTIIVVFILLFVFIYPGMYRYVELTNNGNTYPVRINVITGHTEVYTGVDGWIK